MNEDNDKLKDFIGKGSEIAGAAASGAMGFLAAGPVGAAIGAASGPIITMGIKSISDYAQRVLSERESTRVAGVAALTIEKIRNNIENGEEIRTDDFFKERTKAQPKASELFEGVLLKSRSEHEEKKLPLYANLFATSCFQDNLDSDDVNWIIQLLDKVTYRHIEVLYAFYEIGDIDKWKWGMIDGLSKDEAIIASTVTELKNGHLLTPDHWGDSPVKITDFGKKIIETLDFPTVVDESYKDVSKIFINDTTYRDRDAHY